MILDKINFDNKHEKKSFWATDAEKPVFDLYHSWIGTPPTNPIERQTLFMFEVGKMVELALVKKLIEAGVVKDLGENQMRVEMEREGVPITGYIDAVLTDGSPLEIKSYYGIYQEYDLEKGNPKISYLKQLAIYMDFLDKDSGILVYISRATGKSFEFTLKRIGTSFKCNKIEFDITDTYKRWSRLYQNNILPKNEPKSEYRYKIPLDKIDWKKTPKSVISKARNNHKVISDHWSVQYSDYKDLLIEREGTTLGYTDKEIEQIKELTKGYSTWK